MTTFAKAPPRTVEQPNIEAHKLVLVTTTPDKYIKYAHSIGEHGDWLRTKCGIGVGMGFLWSVFHATLIRSDWCGKCWR
jgi:hypothetical protein